MSWRAQCHSTLYSFKNYTEVSGANFAVMKVLVLMRVVLVRVVLMRVVLMVKEVVVGRS